MTNTQKEKHILLTGINDQQPIQICINCIRKAPVER
jgi:hypothetical protein